MDANENVGLENYRQLLSGVAQVWSVEESKLLTEQRLELADGVSVRFEHLPHTNLCRISLPLGPMPDEMDALKCMLESNTHPEQGLLPVMALDEESGQPMVYVHFPALLEAENAVMAFLTVGSFVLREHWQDMWKEDFERASASLNALA